MPPEEQLLNLVLAELKSAKVNLKEAVNRIQSDIDSLYSKLGNIESSISQSGVTKQRLEEVEEFKKEVSQILTFDDMKKIKEERENSLMFRAKVVSVAAAWAAIVSLIVSLATIYFTRTH